MPNSVNNTIFIRFRQVSLAYEGIFMLKKNSQKNLKKGLTRQMNCAIIIKSLRENDIKQIINVDRCPSGLRSWS